MGPAQRYALNNVITLVGSIALGLGLVVLFIWWVFIWPWALLTLPALLVVGWIVAGIQIVYEESLENFDTLKPEERAKYLKPEPRVQDSPARKKFFGRS